jgi:antitoxin MazE
MKMQIGRWGNSLAVRLPKALVERLGLREGDEVDLSGIEKSAGDAVRKRREDAIEVIKARAWIPAGFKIDREELYDELMEERHGRLWR